MDNIGLVTFNNISGFQRINLPKKVVVYHFGQPYILEFSKDEHNALDIGRVLLTQTGEELARVCACEPVVDFPDYVFSHWLGKGIAISSPFPRAPNLR
ncbi:MAG: hypothetical protein ABSB33_11030 [Tepidisphaeraceae bacterium]|jgi:hypothetical protein